MRSGCVQLPALTGKLSSTGPRRAHGAVADSGDARASGFACDSTSTGFVTAHPVEQKMEGH